MKQDKKSFYESLAWRLPRKLVYFCVIRMWAKTTTGKYGNTEVPALTVDEMLKRWPK